MNFIIHLMSIGAVAITTGFTNGISTQPIWLDNVQCGGSERSLFSCLANAIGTENCVHAEDAGVICIQGNLDQYSNYTCSGTLLIWSQAPVNINGLYNKHNAF